MWISECPWQTEMFVGGDQDRRQLRPLHPLWCWSNPLASDLIQSVSLIGKLGFCEGAFECELKPNLLCESPVSVNKLMFVSSKNPSFQPQPHVSPGGRQKPCTMWPNCRCGYVTAGRKGKSLELNGGVKKEKASKWEIFWSKPCLISGSYNLILIHCGIIWTLPHS